MSDEDFKWSHDEARTIGPALRDHSGVLTLELGNEITKINAWKLESMGLTRLGQELYIPTYLSFDKEKGILFGTDAKAAQTQNPDHTVHGFINLIGLERTDVQAIVTMQNSVDDEDVTKRQPGKKELRHFCSLVPLEASLAGTTKQKMERRTKGDTAGVAAGKPTPEAENQDPGFPVRIGKYDGEIEGTAANLGQERGRLVHQIADLERHGAKIFDQDRELDQHARIASMRAFDPLLIDCGPGGDDMEAKTLVKIFVEEIVNSLLDSFEDAGSITSDFLGPPAMKAIVISPAHFTDYQKELLQEAVYEGGLAIYPMSRKPLLCEPELRGLIGSFADRPTAETLLIDVGMQNFQLSHLDEMGYYKARCGQAGLGVERMLIALENAMLVAEWPRIQGHAQRSSKDRMADRTEAARVFKALTVPPLARKDGKANFNIKWESCTKQCPVTLDVLKDACEMVLMMMKDFIHKFLRDNGIDPAKKPFNIELIGGYSDSTILHDMCPNADWIRSRCEIRDESFANDHMIFHPALTPDALDSRDHSVATYAFRPCFYASATH
ncbi:unnamed protein product, partial [Mesorhabditis spiculigera]